MISKSIISLLIEEPFYAHLMSGVNRKITTEIPTAAVGITGNTITLFINEDFFQNKLKSASSKVAVIKHEILHLVFKHLFRTDLLRYDRLLFNLAADLVVNQYIGKWNLPDSAVTLKSFPDLVLESNQTVEYYYNRIKKLSSGSEEKKSTNPESFKALNKILQDNSHSDHSLWGNTNSGDYNAAEITFGKLLIDAKNRSGYKGYASLPKSIKSQIQIEIDKQQPKVDWKRVIKLFNNSSTKTYLKYTNRRVSKRYGTRPGLRVSQHSRLLIAIDTSGSINKSEIDLFFSEIHGVWKSGTEIDVLECDADVQNKYKYKGTLPNIIYGGGGTSFDPVFNHINNNRGIKYDGCIYLTDGYANRPTVKPYCPVLWIISPDGLVDDHLWFGRITKLENQIKSYFEV